MRPIICRKFVARDAELSYLHERRREAGSSHGGMVFVVGEAGIGKSRLLREFCASLAKSRWRIGRGSCLQFVQRPYAPVLDALAQIDAKAGRMTPAASKDEQFELIAAALARETARSGVVLAIEDVHWADAATFELLTYIGTKLDTLRMLVVASMRPEELHDEHPSYAAGAKLLRSPRAGRIDLAPLAGPELRAFIDDALTGFVLPDDYRRIVALTSEGNPYFTEELLKSAVERYAAQSGAAPAHSVPSTISAALSERLSPLGHEHRRVLAQAAVIGREFELPLLAHTLDAEPSALLPALRHARDFQLIEEQQPGHFRFRHALTREAIYSSFLASELVPMHRTIAAALEAREPDDRHTDRLAYHWWAAGDAAKALLYNERAGDAASRLFAHQDAITSYERALSARADSLTRARIMEKIGERQVALGRFGHALRIYNEAAALYAAEHDHEREAACLVRASLQRYTLDEAAPTADLEALLERLAPDEVVARSRAHLGVAWIAATFYEPTVAARHLDRVAPTAMAIDDIRLRYHNVRAWVWMILGDAERFRAEHRAWLEAAAAVDTAAVAAAQYNGAFCYALFALHDDAMRAIQSALEVAERARNRNAIASAHTMSAYCSVLRGDLGAAKAAVDAVRASRIVGGPMAAAVAILVGAYLDDAEMIDFWFTPEAAGNALNASLHGAGLAKIFHRRGLDEDARRVLHRGIELGERPRGSVLTMLAVARYGAEEDVPAAREVLRRAAEAPSDVVERPALALFDALVARRGGAADEAVRHARSAADEFARLGFRLLEASARELSGDEDEALSLYRRCGALYEVRRLERRQSLEDPVSARGTEPPTDARRLTGAETELAVLVARGLSNMEISRELRVSHKTVEKRLGVVFQKLGIVSRAQLAAHIAQYGMDAARPVAP